MTRHAPTSLALAATLLLAACGGGGGGSSAAPITCAWLQAPNCWKATAAAATACTDASAQGTLDGAGTTCTYASGVTVAFPVPAADQLASQGPWRFTVKTPAGATCAAFTETSSGLTVTTSLGTFSETASASGLVLTCPDGQAYEIPLQEAFSCLFDLPGYATSGSGGSASFSLLGAPVGDTTLFACFPQT